METTKPSIKKNALFNTIRSTLSILFPLITYPYAARVVGVDNIGRVNYSASIAAYFTLLAVFGVSTYGIRECAAIRSDREATNRKASELFSLNLLTLAASLILMAVTVLAIPKLRPYNVLLVIQSLSVIFTTIGIDWVNVVFEDYKYTTIRGLFINLVNMLLLFLFVRTKSDYYVYAVLSVTTVVFIGLVNFFYCKRYVNLHLTFERETFSHFKKLVPFFINELSVAIYVSSDITILGYMKGDFFVGIYSVAVKIYTIVKSVFIAIFSVTLPRLSSHALNHETKEFKGILSETLSYFILLAFPATAGMLLYSKSIVLVVGGAEYIESSISLKLLAIALLFAVFGGIVTRCINIPLGYEAINSKVTTFAAIENIVLNIPMIYFFNEKGAAATTILAEFSVLAICTAHLIKEKADLSGIINKKDLRDALIGTAFIVLSYCIITMVMPISDDVIPRAIQLVIGILVSVAGYALILIAFRNHIIMRILKKISRH